jgi:arsenite-transporting ATPase
VDCAPTGETLRLLSFPEVMRWWIERLFPIQRQAMKVLRPLARTVLNVPAPDDRVFAALEDIFGRLDQMRTILSNPDITSMRMVVNPEKMVIKEAQRLYTYLNLYGYTTDMVVVNRVIPPEVNDPYFAAWRATQAKWEALVHEAFAPLAIRRAPLMDQEVVGMEMLGRVAAHVFGEEDPSTVYFRGNPQELVKQDGAYVLSLMLPFVEKADVQLAQVGNELNVTLGAHRRNIVLPASLAGMHPAGAKMEQERLNIRFERE